MIHPVISRLLILWMLAWGRLFLFTSSLYCDGSVGVDYLSYSHPPPSEYHLKYIIYHFVFSALTCPPVALTDPANILRPFCDSFTVSYRGVYGEGVTCMIMKSSTKQYPTRWKESCEILHLKTAPCPASLRQFKRGELTMSHIVGDAPFPWPKTCGGGLSGIAHKSPL